MTFKRQQHVFITMKAREVKRKASTSFT